MCGRPDHESNVLVSIRSRISILSALQVRDVIRLTQIYVHREKVKSQKSEDCDDVLIAI